MNDDPFLGAVFGNVRGIDSGSLIRDERQSIGYQELFDHVQSVAGALESMGIVPGDRIAYLGRNSVEFLEVALAARWIGGIFVSISFRAASPEISEILLDAEPQLAIVDEAYLTTAQEALGDFDIPLVVVTDDTNEADEYPDFNTWRAGGAGTSEPVADGGPWLLMYSSGTTGTAKGVVLGCEGLDALLDIFGVWDMKPTSVVSAVMPLFHIGGLGWVLAALRSQSNIVIQAKADAASIIRNVSNWRITHLFVVPSVLAEIVALPGIDDVDIQSLRLIYYGASPIVHHVLVRGLSLFGQRFMQGYGSTEAGLLSFLMPEEHDLDSSKSHRLKSAGRPAEGVTIRILDSTNGDPVPSNVVGEILAKSPGTMIGYWGRSDKESDVWRDDSWIRTGDAGYFDVDGYLYLHDRMKDMIISGGENIYPAEIERVIESHDAVSVSAVVGLHDERWGEVPYAFVVPVNASTVTDAELEKLCLANLAKYKCPVGYEFVDALPMNANGKVLKRELRSIVASRGSSS